MDFGTPTKLRYAKQVAAALGFVGLINLDRVAMKTVGGRSPCRARRSFAAGPASGGWSSSSTTSSPAATATSAEPSAFTMRATGRGVAIVLSDFLDKNGYEDGLRYLAARNLDVYAIQILSHEEIHPEVAGDLKLTDIEDGDEAEVTISAPAAETLPRHPRRLQRLAELLLHTAGNELPVYSNQVPFEKLVLGYLRSRGLVR